MQLLASGAHAVSPATDVSYVNGWEEIDPLSRVEMKKMRWQKDDSIVSILYSLPRNPYLAMLDSAPLCSKPAPPKLDVHSTTLLTGDAGGYHCVCSCFDRAEPCRRGCAGGCFEAIQEVWGDVIVCAVALIAACRQRGGCAGGCCIKATQGRACFKGYCGGEETAETCGRGSTICVEEFWPCKNTFFASLGSVPPSASPSFFFPPSPGGPLWLSGPVVVPGPLLLSSAVPFDIGR